MAEGDWEARIELLGVDVSVQEWLRVTVYRSDSDGVGDGDALQVLAVVERLSEGELVGLGLGIWLVLMVGLGVQDPGENDTGTVGE